MKRPIVFAAAVLVPLAAYAQTLAQKQTMASEEARLAGAASNASSKCQTPIPASFEWQSFLATDKVGDKTAVVYQNPPSDMCSVPLAELQAMCQDGQARQAIAAKIKSYQCGYQAGATPSLSIDPAGKLLFQSSYDAFHHMDHTDEATFVEQWLGQHL